MNGNPRTDYEKTTPALCLFVVGCILAAGLWPFHTPRNAVEWLKGDTGLRFGGRGAAVSEGAFDLGNQPVDGFSLEIWLTSNRMKEGTILAFDSSPGIAGACGEDLAVNIFGFMPVGLVFFAYFSSMRRIGHPTLAVVLLGFLLSFTVEA